MSSLSRIIAEPLPPARTAPPPAPAASRWPLRLALLAAAWGCAAAWSYHAAGLTLSHYDAKAHLVVARRVIDSLTPGWQQIGAVWLPLPHLLNLLPVQVDAFYRTGASGVAISIASLALLVYAASRMALLTTGSRAAASLAAVLLAANPNLLYLQSTPMTEPLLLGLCALGVLLLTEAVGAAHVTRLHRAGFVLALACLTRYEAWPVTAAGLAAFVLARWRVAGRPRPSEAARVAAWPAGAILLFLVHSKVTIGEWFVTGGFYVPDPAYLHQPLVAVGAVWFGARALGSDALLWTAAAGVVFIAWTWLRRREAAAIVVPLALLAASALPAYAFFQGHPFRIRYMVPLVAAAAVAAAVAVGRTGRLRGPLAAGIALLVLWEARPFDSKAAMVLEAQWDMPKSAARRAVTACLPAPGHGVTVMASMGSLAHYMQELSHAGYDLRDFLHEGNGDIWLAAYAGPVRYVRWILMEEEAEGGDMLAIRAREDPRFLEGFTKRCAGGGVALYARDAD